MNVQEGQEQGSLLVLIAALAVYGICLMGQPEGALSLAHLPQAVQKTDTRAVEFTATRVNDGIYFFAPERSLAEMIAFAGLTVGKLSAIPTFDTVGDHDAVAIHGGQPVPAIGDLTAAKRLALGLPIDLNSATLEELTLLPGIGEKTAIQIIRLREIRGKLQNLTELTDIPGIKEKRLDLLRHYLMIRQR